MYKQEKPQQKKTNLCTFSALSVIAQQNLEAIQTIREKHDPAFKRWQPHINICFPFISPDKFDQQFAVLQDEFKEFQSFTITFKEVDYFPHGTIFLVPQTEPENILGQIYEKVVKVLPNCKADREFTPHMTLGKFNKKFIEKQAQSIKQNWKEWKVQVKGIHMIEREKDTPFKTTHIVRFC